METKLIDFWCVKCRKDFRLVSQKRFVNSVINESWTARCPECAKTLYRLSDNQAGQDPYFRLSRYMRSQVRKHQDNLLQVNDPRFNLLYPEHAKKIAEQEDQKERKSFEEIQEK